MHNITLIFTHHSEIGKCNADELYRIINAISPEVIFEELPKDLSDILYKLPEHPDEPLESKSIKRYKLNHEIQLIPVDIPYNHSLTSEMQSVFNTFKKNLNYIEIENEQKQMIEQYGFTFLNSIECLELYEKKKGLEEGLINFSINKNQQTRTSNSFYEYQETREHEMIKNIYNYSKDNKYNTAIFTLGSGHRKSILQKIEEYDKNEKLKLNWKVYNPIELKKFDVKYFLGIYTIRKRMQDEGISNPKETIKKFTTEFIEKLTSLPLNQEVILKDNSFFDTEGRLIMKIPIEESEE